MTVCHSRSTILINATSTAMVHLDGEDCTYDAHGYGARTDVDVLEYCTTTDVWIRLTH